MAWSGLFLKDDPNRGKKELIIFKGVVSWSQVQLFTILHLELSSFLKSNWAKEVSDTLNVFR